MQIIVDLDGTLCTEERTASRCLAKPIEKAIQTINNLYNEGHIIIIYTARTWIEYEMTVDWLQRFDVKYHQLFMGKPIGDIWLDDRAINPTDWDFVADLIDKKSKKK